MGAGVHSTLPGSLPKSPVYEGTPSSPRTKDPEKEESLPRRFVTCSLPQASASGPHPGWAPSPPGAAGPPQPMHTTHPKGLKDALAGGWAEGLGDTAPPPAAEPRGHKNPHTSAPEFSAKPAAHASSQAWTRPGMRPRLSSVTREQKPASAFSGYPRVAIQPRSAPSAQAASAPRSLTSAVPVPPHPAFRRTLGWGRAGGAVLPLGREWACLWQPRQGRPADLQPMLEEQLPQGLLRLPDLQLRLLPQKGQLPLLLLLVQLQGGPSLRTPRAPATAPHDRQQALGPRGQAGSPPGTGPSPEGPLEGPLPPAHQPPSQGRSQGLLPTPGPALPLTRLGAEVQPAPTLQFPARGPFCSASGTMAAPSPKEKRSKVTHLQRLKEAQGLLLDVGQRTCRNHEKGQLSGLRWLGLGPRPVGKHAEHPGRAGRGRGPGPGDGAACSVLAPPSLCLAGPVRAAAGGLRDGGSLPGLRTPVSLTGSLVLLAGEGRG